MKRYILKYLLGAVFCLILFNISSGSSYATNQATPGNGASATTIDNFSGTGADTIDSNDTTNWMSSAKVNAFPWLKVDLGSAKTIGSFRLLEPSSGDCHIMTQYQIESSPNDSSWTTRYTSGTGLTGGDTGAVSFTPANDRYWKITALAGSASCGTQIYTFELNSASIDHYAIAITTPQTAGVCVTGTNTITAQDALNGTVTDDTSTVNMTSSGTGVTFYTANDCSSSTTSYTLSSGVSNMYYKTNVAQSFTITATKASSVETGTSSSITVNANSQTRLVITLPGQTLIAGTGNTGTVLSQTGGTTFQFNLTATDDYFNRISSYTGDKTLVFSGPGVGSSTPTVQDKTGANQNYGSSTVITFSSESAPIYTRLWKSESTTITATDAGSYGYASSSLAVSIPRARIQGGTAIKGGTRF